MFNLFRAKRRGTAQKSGAANDAVRDRMHGAVALRTDITAQQAATSMHCADAALNHLSEPVYTIDPATLKIAYANAAAVAMFGWDRQQLHDISAFDIDLDCDLAEVTEKIGKLRRRECRHITFRGQNNGITYEAKAQLIAPEIGDARFFVMLRDCSDELALNRARDSFVSTVSHELRTPLTSIKGALGLVLSGSAGDMPDKARNLLEIAHRNADRLVLIVNDILDLEKLAAGKMDYDLRIADLRDTVSDACAAHQSYARACDVTIVNATAGCDTGTPMLASFDANRIHQVLTNLISNACKFSDPGSEISVSIGQTDGVHVVSVTDHGQGIPASALETVFDRFTQVASSRRGTLGGTGLGLSIVKAIVESHGGQVMLRSTHGVGTTVSFTLADAAPLRLVDTAARF